MVILLIFALNQVCHAQKVGKALVDSLINELPKMKDDSNKVRTLATICFEMRNINPGKGLQPGLSALHLAEKLHDQPGKGLSHIALAFCNITLSNIPEIIDHCQEANTIFEALGENNLLCWSCLALANAYMPIDSTIAANYLSKAKALFPQTTSVLWKIRILGFLGNTYRNIRQIDSAMKYITVSLKLSEQYHFEYEIMLAKTRLGLFYYFHETPDELDSDFALLNTASEYFKSTGITRLVAENSISLGKIRLMQLPEKGPLRKQYLWEAESYTQEGLTAAKEIRYMSSIFNANMQLYNIYKSESKFEKSLGCLWMAFLYKDSIAGIERIYKSSILSWKAEKELKEKQMELLKVKNRQQLILNLATAAGVVILIIIVLLIVRNRRKLKRAYELVNRQKKEIEYRKEEVEAQKEEIETQNDVLVDTLDKLKQTESQMIHSAKMASLGMLTAGIAHEINNPVNFINSGAISLQKDYEDLQQFIQSLDQKFPGVRNCAEEQGVYELMTIMPQTIDDIKTGVIRTSEIINGLRNFTQMDASELKEADIHEGLQSTLLLLNSKIKDRIAVVKEFDDRIGFIKCYPGPLNQVFMNLINNAIDAIDQDITKNPQNAGQHQIGITTKLEETGLHKQVKIVISDTGIGIPDKIRDKLFDPFFTTKDVGKGTGLGLSICHGIVEKHGGSITFVSKLNEGSAFTITIPVA